MKTCLALTEESLQNLLQQEMRLSKEEYNIRVSMTKYIKGLLPNECFGNSPFLGFLVPDV